MTYGPFTLSGEGSHAFGTSALILVTDAEVKVTAWPPRTRVLGAMHPLGLWHVGWIGVGWGPDDASGLDPIVAEGFFLEFEHQDKYFANKRVDVYVGTLYWRLLMGAEATVTLYNL